MIVHHLMNQLDGIFLLISAIYTYLFLMSTHLSENKEK
ncbi:hypothetical protein B4147_2963 [Bacillus wiedmannii]|uniref:Uncharacterized protein n=1 Tax=Bacillus wiedmannii TaxID=1890302 RepID=A0A0G8CCE1_9BACI|nr:hypothetical protein B4147_2963 [Bacillus wiedmannii]